MPVSYGIPPPDLRPRPLTGPPDTRSDSDRFRMTPFFSHPPKGSITPLDDSRDDFPPAPGGTARERPLGDMPPPQNSRGRFA